MPEPKNTDPLFPFFAEPELNTSRPLDPSTPALLLHIITFPLLVCVPSPDLTTREPPDAIALRPDDKPTSPPEPLVPRPTLISIAPLRPDVLAPLPITIVPEFPIALVPELNASCPLLPVTPPFADATRTDPLLVCVPSPLLIVILPPLDAV